MKNDKNELLLSIDEALKSYSYFHKKNPTFGMDIFIEGFQSDGIALVQKNEIFNKSNPVKFGFYTLVLCLYGETIRKVNQYEFKISKYSLQLIPPNSLFSFESITETTITYVLAFTDEFMKFGEQTSESELITALLAYHQNNIDNVNLPINTYTRVKNIYEAINSELHEKQEDYLDIIKLLILKLLFILKRCKTTTTPVTSVHFETKAQKIAHDYLNLVEKQFIEVKKVSDYAKLLNVSSKHLSETIKKVLGNKALFYIHNRLLKEAQYLLEFTNLDIVEISTILHFNNQSVFTKFFKTFCDMTPSQYRLVTKQALDYDLLCKQK